MITRIIVGLNVLAFAWEMLVTHGAILAGTIPQNSPLYDYMLVPAYVLQLHVYYPIVTGAFLHGSIIHIFMNMIFIASVGRFIEQLMGSARTALIYIVSLLGGAAGVIFFSQMNAPTLGASGAAFGLFGALFAAGLKLGEPGMQLVRANVGILAINLLLSFTVPGISWQGHVGGLISGFLFAYLIYWPRRPAVAHVVDTQTGAHYESQLETPQP